MPRKSKNPNGLSTPEILRAYFHREQIRRRLREPAQRAKRELKADSAHVKRVARWEFGVSAQKRRIELMEKHPSALAVQQLAEICADTRQPSEIRMRAALVLLRFAKLEPEV